MMMLGVDFKTLRTQPSTIFSSVGKRKEISFDRFRVCYFQDAGCGEEGAFEH